MGVNIGKKELTYNKILEVLVDLRRKYPSSWVTNVDVARKVGLSPATASGYLKALWKRGEILRARTLGNGWTYRCIVEGEDIEPYKTANHAHYAWQAYVPTTKDKVST